MPRRSIAVALSALIASFALLAGTAAADQTASTSSKAKQAFSQPIRIWTSVGPRAGLANATVTITDATGKVVARARTSRTTGSVRIDLSGRKGLALPLMARTTGGAPTALLPSGKTISFEAFKGHLVAPIFGVRHQPITLMSPVSTAAVQIATSDTRAAHAAAVRKVTRALGFTGRDADIAIRWRNSAVGFKQLAAAARRAGGYDAFIEKIAEAAAAGRKLKHLRPPSAAASGAISQRLIRGGTPLARQSSASSGPVCSASLPSGPSTSQTVLTDVAEVGVGALMKVAGTPSSASSSITGMAFAAAGVPTSDSEAEADNAAIWNELGCIQEQLTYLEAQVGSLTLMTLMSNASSCDSWLAGDNIWQGYNDVIDGGTYAPIDPTDNSIVAYMDDWADTDAECGGSINKDLFTPLPGYTTSGWQQMVANTVGSSKWWSQSQTQTLQSFLSYWGTDLYEQFILQNEYNNYKANYQQATNDAGVNPSNTSVCKPGSTASTQHFCVWRSNIMQAYPPDLYSDELAVVKNGLAMDAIPLGAFSPAPIMNPAPATMASSTSKFYSQTPASAQKGGGITNVNPGWFFNYYLNFTPYTSGGYGNQLRLFNFGTTPTCVSKQLNPCPGPTTTTESASFAWNATNWFNGLGVNPKGYGSAVQTYNNPQSLTRTPNSGPSTGLVCSDASDINSTNNQGVKGLTALYNALNQAPNGSSGPLDGTGYGSGDVLYMISDGNSYMTIQLKNMYAYLTWNGCMGNMVTGSQPLLSDVPIKPLIATLLARSWWSGTPSPSSTCSTTTGTYGCSGSGAATAAKFTPANPPTS